jgi:hypothetical protein
MAWGQNPVADPAAITLPASKLDEYVGQYRVAAEPEIAISLSREGSALYSEGERTLRTEVKAESPDHFFVPMLRGRLRLLLPLPKGPAVQAER